jgi:hypothetical protein
LRRLCKPTNQPFLHALNDVLSCNNPYQNLIQRFYSSSVPSSKMKKPVTSVLQEHSILITITDHEGEILSKPKKDSVTETETTQANSSVSKEEATTSAPSSGLRLPPFLLQHGKQLTQEEQAAQLQKLQEQLNQLQKKQEKEYQDKMKQKQATKIPFPNVPKRQRNIISVKAIESTAIADEELFTIHTIYEDLIWQDLDRFLAEERFPCHIKRFLNIVSGNVQAIMNGEKLPYPEQLIDFPSKLVVIGYKPYGPISYCQDLFALFPLVDESANNKKTDRKGIIKDIELTQEQRRWKAHRYLMDEYRCFMSSLKIGDDYKDKFHIFLFLYLLKNFPEHFYPFLLEYNQILNSCKRLDRIDFSSLPGSSFKAILASFFANRMLKNKIDPDVCTFNTLLTLYIGLQGTDIVSKLLYLMGKRNVKVDIVTYTALMSYLYAHPNKTKLEQVYREMRSTFPIMDQQAYVSTLTAATRARHFDLIKEIYETMRKEIKQLNHYAVNTMVMAYTDQGEFEEAEKLFFEVYGDKLENLNIS